MGLLSGSDMKHLFASIKQEKGMRNYTENAADALRKVERQKRLKDDDHKVKDAKTENTTIVKEAEVKEAEIVIDEDILAGAGESVQSFQELQEMMDDPVIVTDYVAFVQNYALRSLDYQVEQSMIQQYSFDVFAQQLSESLLLAFKKGVDSEYMNAVMTYLKNTLVNKDVTIGSITFQLSEDNTVFTDKEAFQKFLYFLFLDRLVLDQQAFLIFKGISPEEQLDEEAKQELQRSSTLFGTSLVRTLAVGYAKTHYHVDLFEQLDQAIVTFRENENDCLDVYLALVAYYSNVDAQKERVVIGFTESMSHIDWKKTSFQLPPESIQQLVSSVNDLKRTVQRKETERKDVTDVYEKLNEQIQVNNELNQVIQKHMKDVSLVNDAVKIMSKSQQDMIQTQHAVLKMMENDRQSQILKEVQAVKEMFEGVTVDADASSESVDGLVLEQMLERLLSNKFSDFGDMVANKVNEGMRIRQSDDYVTIQDVRDLKVEITGLKNQIKAKQTDILDHIKAQETKLETVITGLSLMDANTTLQEHLSQLLRNYVGTLRNELLTRLDALVGKMYVVESDNQGNLSVQSNRTLSDLYELVYQISQKNLMSQSTTDYRQVLEALQEVKQQVQQLANESIFKEGFVEDLANQLRVSLSDVQKSDLTQQVQSFVQKGDFDQLQDFLVEQFGQLVDQMTTESLVQDMVHGKMLQALGQSGSSFTLQDTETLKLAMQMSQERDQIRQQV